MSFHNNTSLILYSKETSSKKNCPDINELNFSENKEGVAWLNTYGLRHIEEMTAVVESNHWDPFLIKLILDQEHSNKTIQLENSLFVAIKVLKTERSNLSSEQMFFVVTPHFLWSIQEKKGDYFGWIRERIDNNGGIVRSQNADYLLYLLLESIIDNYLETNEKHLIQIQKAVELSIQSPKPESVVHLEKMRKNSLKIKKATSGFQDLCSKLEKIDRMDINTKYFSELKEQSINLLADIDFHLQEIESGVNMVFSLQNHRMNEVMKALTMFSVIFIPLTFVAGLYGMNFADIPMLQHPYGFYAILLFMFLVALGAIFYFKRKKWF